MSDKSHDLDAELENLFQDVPSGSESGEPSAEPAVSVEPAVSSAPSGVKKPLLGSGKGISGAGKFGKSGVKKPSGSVGSPSPAPAAPVSAAPSPAPAAPVSAAPSPAPAAPVPVSGRRSGGGAVVTGLSAVSACLSAAACVLVLSNGGRTEAVQKSVDAVSVRQAALESKLDGLSKELRQVGGVLQKQLGEKSELQKNFRIIKEELELLKERR